MTVLVTTRKRFSPFFVFLASLYRFDNLMSFWELLDSYSRLNSFRRFLVWAVAAVFNILKVFSSFAIFAVYIAMAKSVKTHQTPKSSKISKRLKTAEARQHSHSFCHLTVLFRFDSFGIYTALSIF